MKLIEYDPKIEFERHCGADVKYVAHEIKFQWLNVDYQIPSVDGKIRSVRCKVPNGLPTSLRSTAHRCAQSAFDAAYHLTGRRESDMKQLLQGKTV